MYLTAPIIMALCQIFARWVRWTPLLGLLIMCVALVLSSFSTTTTHLILTQGIMYGLGGGIAYCPCIVVSDTCRQKIIWPVLYWKLKTTAELLPTDAAASIWTSGS
jgi:hypothetical protein